MDITIEFTGDRLIATKGEVSITLPDRMSFLVGAGPQRIDTAFADALKGKYPIGAEDLEKIKRWLQ